MHIHWSKQEAIWSEDLPAALPHQNSTILQTAKSISVKLCYMTDTFLVKTFIAVFFFENLFCAKQFQENGMSVSCVSETSQNNDVHENKPVMFFCKCLKRCSLCEGRCQYHTWKMQRLQNSSIFQLWPIPPLWQLVTMPNNATHMLLRIFPNETIGAESSKTPHSAQIS